MGSAAEEMRRGREGKRRAGDRSPRAGALARAGKGADVSEKAASSRPHPSLALVRNRAGKGRRRKS